METTRDSVAAIGPSYITVPEAARSLPSGRNGRPTHTATIVRWITSGSKGPDGEIVRLQAVRLGGRWLTTREWLQDFASHLTPDFAASSPSPIRSSAARARQSARAGAELDRIGI